MGLFNRSGRKADKDAGVVQPPVNVVDADDELESAEESIKEAPADRSENGPYDHGELDAQSAGAYLDFGSIRIPLVEGIGLRLEFTEDRQRVVAIAIDVAKSTLQLQAFALPSSTGAWGEIRAQLNETVTEQGGDAYEVDSELGTGLHATLPAMEDGKTATRRVFFYGVDGPRWFLRGAVTGAATQDDQVLAELIRLMRLVVVVRGKAAVPPRDLLEIVVPEAMAQQLANRTDSVQE